MKPAISTKAVLAVLMLSVLVVVGCTQAKTTDTAQATDVPTPQKAEDAATLKTPAPAPAQNASVAAGEVKAEEYKETNLPFNSVDMKAGGYQERVAENHTIVATCSGFSLKALRLGDRDIPLKATAVTSDCMIETKDYGKLRLKMNTATFSANILVTPKQEDLFKKLAESHGESK